MIHEVFQIAGRPIVLGEGYDAGANLEAPCMASLYRRGGIWWGAFRAHTGKRIAKSTGQRNKQLASWIVSRWEMLHALTAVGIISPIELETMETEKKSPLVVLDSFVRTLESKWVRTDTDRILRGFISRAKVGTIGEFSSPSIVGRIHTYLREIEQERDVQRRRLNMHVRAINRFAEWLVNQSMIKCNEVAKVPRLRENDDRKIVHRAFTPGEMERLAHGRHGLYYLFRAWTGLRDSEASQLLASDLAGDILTVRREVTKNDHGCRLPLPRRLVSLFGLRVGGDAPLFADLPATREHRSDQLAQDLATAGLPAAQLSQRSFRMSHNTWYRAAGVSSDVIATLRRDKGKGSEMLRRWNYTDDEQLWPLLRDAHAATEAWYDAEVARVSSKRVHA